MIVKVFMTGTNPAVVFDSADNVDITPSGALRVSGSGSKDKPLVTQVGGVASGLWIYYQVMDESIGFDSTTVDTTTDGEVTPS